MMTEREAEREAERAGIGALVEAGATLRARLLDGYETVPWPVAWLDWQDHEQDHNLCYCGAGAEEQVHCYGIDQVELLEERGVIFHTSGETSVAALILEPCQSADLNQRLRSWARAVRNHDRYPTTGWRFQG